MEAIGPIVVALIGAASGIYAVIRSRPVEEAKVKGDEAERKLSETELIIESWRTYAQEKDKQIDRLNERLAHYEKGSPDA